MSGQEAVRSRLGIRLVLVNSCLNVRGLSASLPVRTLVLVLAKLNINHANEKLQLHFNRFNFMLERELFEREGLEIEATDYTDNSACVELLEKKGSGIYSCLDDTCKAPKVV